MKEPAKRGTRQQARALDASAPIKRGTDEDRKPVVEAVAVPVAMMQAAVTIADQLPKKETSAEQRGILLHQRDNGQARIVGYQPGVGGRLFVGAFAVPGRAPSWLANGVLLRSEGLKAQLAMISKRGNKNDERMPYAMLVYKKGEAAALLTDEPREGETPSMQFRVVVAQRVDEIAVYEDKFEAASFVDLDEDGSTRAKKDWDPVGLNSKHMKQCIDIAKLLEVMLDKEQRSNGVIVRTFTSGEEGAPRIFDFDGVPGALLMVAGDEVVDRTVPLQTARILAPATKLTIAALKAHATRNRQWADEATDETVKARYLAAEQGFNERVADILARVPGSDRKALPRPKPVPQITQREEVEPGFEDLEDDEE